MGTNTRGNARSAACMGPVRRGGAQLKEE